MKTFKQYLSEAKKFKSLKPGDEINVEAERQQIYANPGYVPSAKVTKMTLIVRQKIDNTTYSVIAKGKFTKVPGGGKIPKQFRFEIYSPTHGGLFSNYPKPLKYSVVPI